MELILGMDTSCGEGNISWFNERQEKLKELIKENKPKILLETGFNMGHSAHLICQTIKEIKENDDDYKNSKISFYIFDICEHSCVKPNFQILKNYWKDVVNLYLIEGDTFNTLNNFFTIFENKIDFAEIDGCHTYEGVQNDINSVWKNISENGIIYVDDYKSSKITLWGVDKGVDDLNWLGFETNSIDGLFWAKKKNIIFSEFSTKKRLIIHQPTNHYNKKFRYYNIFFDNLIDDLSKTHEVVVNRYYKDANKGYCKIKLDWDNSESEYTVLSLECEMIIEDYDTKETIIFSISDDLTPLSLNLQSHPNVTKIFISQFIDEKINSHVSDENKHKYEPWIYFPSNEYDYDFYYKKRIETFEYINKMYFRGNAGLRPILDYFSSDVFYGGEPIGGFEPYVTELLNYSLALSLSGRGELCYRDIECMAMGIPLIRFEYLSKLKIPLIPNYHYISVDRPDDLNSFLKQDKDGNDSHANLITNKFLEVKDNKVFLNFISKNAKKYYEDYLSPTSSIDYTRKLLTL